MFLLILLLIKEYGHIAFTTKVSKCDGFILRGTSGILILVYLNFKHVYQVNRNFDSHLYGYILHTHFSNNKG